MATGLILPKNVTLELRREREHLAVAPKPKPSPKVPPAHMVSGWVRFWKVDLGNRVTDAGLEVVKNHKFSTTQYGRVETCGCHQDGSRKIHRDEPGFPLPKDTIIEFRNHDPWENFDGSLTVPTYDVVGYWLPGETSPISKE